MIQRTVFSTSTSRQLCGELLLKQKNNRYNSSNTKKLVQVCEEKNVDVHHIESASQLAKKWFSGKNHVGITAGTSTPEYLINDVHSAILEIARQMENQEARVPA